MKDGKITLRELHPSLRDKLNPNEVICNISVKSSDKTSVLNQILYIKNINTNDVEEYSIVSPIIEVKLINNIEYEIWLNDKIDYVTPEKKIILTNKNTDIMFTYIKDEVLCNVSISCNNGESVVGQKLTVTNNKTNSSKTYILDTGYTVLNLKSSTSYTFSLDEKVDYLTPKNISIVTNKLGIENNVSMQYMLDETTVNVNISSDDGTSITKQTLSVKNNKTQETITSSITSNNVSLKLKTNTSYTFSLDSRKGYIIEEKTATTNGLNGNIDVNLKYLRDLANLIINVRCSDYDPVIGQIVSVQNIATGEIKNHNLINDVLNLKVESNTSYLVWANDKNNYLPVDKKTIDVKEFNSNNNVELIYIRNEINCIISTECDDGSSCIGQTLSFTNIKTEEVEQFEITSKTLNIKLKTLTEYKISSSAKEGYIFQEKTITTSRVGNTDSVTVTYLKDEVNLQVNIINELDTSEIGQIMSIKNVLTSETKDIIISENPMNIKLKSNTEYHINIKDSISNKQIGSGNFKTNTIFESNNPITIICKKMIIYGIDIDETNLDPTTAVTYTDDAIGFKPVIVNSDGTVDYGSWENTFIFQCNRPCMLKDGIVNYYLDENDQTLKENGETADITSGNDGDCMSEFQQTWYKMYKEGDIVKFRVANMQVDETYCSHAFISEKDPTQFGPMYISMFEGTLLDNKLRSLHNRKILCDITRNQFNVYANNNGLGYEQLTWFKLTYLIFLITMVIKSRDSQAKIGKGRLGGYGTSTTGGTITKGRFSGDINSTYVNVKIFYIENFYGNKWKFVDGISLYNKVLSTKLHRPYYNSTYDTTTTISSCVYTYVSKISPSNNFGIVPIESPGSTTTGYCDKIGFGSSGPYYCMYGGRTGYNYESGIFNISVESPAYSDVERTGRLTFS